MPKVADLLVELGTTADDARIYFESLDHDQSGGVDVEEFVSGVCYLRGAARAKDLLRINALFDTVMKQVQLVANGLGLGDCQELKSPKSPVRSSSCSQRTSMKNTWLQSSQAGDVV